MALSEVNVNKNFKVAQAYCIIRDYLDCKYIENILQQDGNIDELIPQDCNLKNKDYNLLHFAFSRHNHECFELLLKHKADFTVKNNEDRTVIHRIIQDKEEGHINKLSDDQFDNKFISSILSAHIEHNIIENPKSVEGITHFHAACMTNHISAVEFFLRNGISPNEAVDFNSSIFPSWTPLHFAARYFCLKTVKILLFYGANTQLQDKNGLTPLALLVKRKIKNDKVWKLQDTNEKMIETIVIHNKKFNVTDDFGFSKLHAACVLKNESVVENILADETFDVNQPVKINSPVFPGYTPLHFAALFNFNIVKLLIKKGADMETKAANGITPFDLCLQRYESESILSLILRKPEWRDIKLADNKTRLVDLVIAIKKADTFIKFLSNYALIDDLTVPTNSPLWPGYTILHLLVIFSQRKCVYENHLLWLADDKRKIEECLNRGAEITKSDANNSTPLHLAFYLQKHLVVDFLLEHHQSTKNPYDNNNLSHFHIACAANNENAVKKFLSNNVDVNATVNATFKYQIQNAMDGNKTRIFFITPGSTALHINVATGNDNITKMLLKNNADIYAKDINGFTPIHRMFTTRVMYYRELIHDLLLNIDDLKDSTTLGGLTHLHVACHLEDSTAVQKLLDNGADINARIVCKVDGSVQDSYGNDEYFDPYGDPNKGPLTFLSAYNNFTTLQFVRTNLDCIKIFLQKGVDIFANIPTTELYDLFEVLRYYPEILIPILENNQSYQDMLYRRFGLKMLHIACYCRDAESTRRLLKMNSEDANVKVREDSEIWPGFTPLHFVTNNLPNVPDEIDDDLRNLIGLLVEYGADITEKNQQNDTPLHAYGHPRAKLFSDTLHPCTGLLLKAVKGFTNNPANSQGISFFHLACIKKEASIVEEYLKHGFDVNQAISHFSDTFSGCSPLHLAIGYVTGSFDDFTARMKIIDLLLKYDADIHARDTYENTPLHEIARTPNKSRITLLDIFIRKGADVNAKNICGETPLELLLETENVIWEEINYFLRSGCSINSYNPITGIGYITHHFFHCHVENGGRVAASDKIIKKLIDQPYIADKDEMGRSFLHNIVSVKKAWIADPIELVEQLINRGLDVDHQDDKGRTALHIAAQFGNEWAVRGLLENGGDINITDKQGKTPFYYAFKTTQMNKKHVTWTRRHNPLRFGGDFAAYLRKMEILHQYISELNRNVQERAMDVIKFDERQIKEFETKSIAVSKKLMIGSIGITLYEFCINAEMIYPHMSFWERSEVDEYFKCIDSLKLDYLFKHTYKKAVERLRLIDVAMNCFGNLIKNQLPKLCCRMIVCLLPSVDLKNVIATEEL